MHPEKIILHHSTSTDGNTYDSGAIRYFHNSYRVDYSVVTKEDFERRKAIGLGSQFDKPWGDHTGYDGLIEKITNGSFSYYEFIMGRDWDSIGAHTIGQNDKSLGLCFIGNYDKIIPPPAMLDEGARIVRFWMRLYNIPKENVFGHRDFANKTCPGMLFDMTNFRNML